MIDHAIKSHRVITPTGTREAVVLISAGRIESVVDKMPEGSFPVTDLGNKILMPGIIDPHVHINEPGRTNWEGFDSGTRAALAGGITTLVDMPLNSIPVTTNVNAFEKKLDAARDGAHVNCGFWGGIIPGNEKEIEPLIEKGVLGFKTFLTHSGIDEFPNTSEFDLRKAMPIIAKHGLPLLVHCELSKSSETYLPGHHPINSLSAQRSYQNYLRSRPKKWEDDAIALMIRLCEEFNCPIHIVHLSSADSIEQINEARQRGLPLTVETAQHYLYFQAEAIRDGHTQFKCAPPIRENENRDRLWMALKEGIIDFVATDHSPAPPELKELDSGDFGRAWGGIASLQLALSVLWTVARNKNCTPENVAGWLCEKPAALPRLNGVKGKIDRGYDADLLVWDPEKELLVTEQMLLHRHKITPYLGEKLYGVVEQTWLAGEKLFDEGKFLHLNKGKLIIGPVRRTG